MRLDAELAEEWRGNDSIRSPGVDERLYALPALTARVADLELDGEGAH
jgi:hypothetical protein